MTKPPSIRLKCDSIPYRTGFIEVITAIHDGCVNVETWNVDADTSLSDVSWIDDAAIPDDSVVNNCELELNAQQARILAEALLAAVKYLEQQ